MKVDASEVLAGGVLSQSQGNPPKLYPCSYYSHKLSPAERNYDLGNHELLANKLALEEWQQVFIHLLSSLINPISNPSDQTKDSTTMHSLFKTVPGGEP